MLDSYKRMAAGQASQTIAAEVESFLVDMVRIPSLSGAETTVLEYVERRFAQLPGLVVERVPMSEKLRKDCAYSSPVELPSYEGRYNLRILRKGADQAKKILFNAHLDVVPPNPEMQGPWSGRVEDGIVHGRGACDDKGPVAALYGMLLLLGSVPEPTQLGTVEIHLVCEEEVGGNGTLALVRTSPEGDCCVVLEPTGTTVCTAIRGAVWFKLAFTGTGGHSGNTKSTSSALLKAVKAMEIIKNYHSGLLAASRDIGLFSEYENPMPLVFGHFESGNWPSTVPRHAVLEGVLGFLQNRTKEQVGKELAAALLDAGFTSGDFSLGFTYAHDCSVVEPEHWFPQLVSTSVRAAGSGGKLSAMPASCDAWLYSSLLGIPTVVYGPGSLNLAHASNESIPISEVLVSASALADCVVRLKHC